MKHQIAKNSFLIDYKSKHIALGAGGHKFESCYPDKLKGFENQPNMIFKPLFLLPIMAKSVKKNEFFVAFCS